MGKQPYLSGVNAGYVLWSALALVWLMRGARAESSESNSMGKRGVQRIFRVTQRTGLTGALV